MEVGQFIHQFLIFIYLVYHDIAAQDSENLTYYPASFPVTYLCNDGTKHDARIEVCENSGGGKLNIIQNGQKSDTVYVRNIESVVLVNSDTSVLCIVRGAPIQKKMRKGKCYALYKPRQHQIKPWMRKKCKSSVIVSMKRVRCKNVYYK